MGDTPWTREIVRCDWRHEYLCQHGVGHPTPNSAAEHDGVRPTVVVLPKPEGVLRNRLLAARAKGKVQRPKGET